MRWDIHEQQVTTSARSIVVSSKAETLAATGLVVIAGSHAEFALLRLHVNMHHINPNRMDRKILRMQWDDLEKSIKKTAQAIQTPGSAAIIDAVDWGTQRSLRGHRHNVAHGIWSLTPRPGLTGARQVKDQDPTTLICELEFLYDLADGLFEYVERLTAVTPGSLWGNPQIPQPGIPRYTN